MDRRVYRWPLLIAFAVVLLIGFFFLMDKTQDEINALRVHEALLEKDRAVVDDVREMLLTQLHLVGTDGYVKNEARKEYDFINKGEVCFEFDNKDLLKNYTIEENQIITEEIRFW
jgi:cell division protein FtsB